MCREEAVSLPNRAADFTAETGLPFSYVIALFQDASGDLPVASDAEGYWRAVQEPEFPVTVDTSAAVFDVTPYTGDALPGKCVLSPEMVILACVAGEEQDDWAFDIIRADAGL